LAIINDALAGDIAEAKSRRHVHHAVQSAQARADFGQRFSVEIIGVVSDVRHTGLQDEPSRVYIRTR